jgi:hypothetical protein
MIGNAALSAIAACLFYQPLLNFGCTDNDHDEVVAVKHSSG